MARPAWPEPAPTATHGTFPKNATLSTDRVPAVGISGHPSGDTVLGNFYQRVDTLTDIAQDVPVAVEALKRVASMMPPEEVEAAKARIPVPQ